ncbi:MAG: hypothetical protein ACFHHU_00920 [Porticoccaceae bacterium]
MAARDQMVEISAAFDFTLFDPTDQIWSHNDFQHVRSWFPKDQFKRVVDQFFDDWRTQRHLVPKDWNSTKKTYVFRLPNAEDEQWLRHTITRVIAKFARQLACELRQQRYALPLDGGNVHDLFLIESCTLHALAFGCTKGSFSWTFWVTKPAISIVCAVIASCIAASLINADQNVIEASCSVYVREERNIGREIRQMIERYPHTWHKADNTDCVMLRQRAVNAFIEVLLLVDGKYGDETIRAEYAVAHQLGVGSDDLRLVYLAIAKALSQPRAVGTIPSREQITSMGILDPGNFRMVLPNSNAPLSLAERLLEAPPAIGVLPPPSRMMALLPPPTRKARQSD